MKKPVISSFEIDNVKLVSVRDYEIQKCIENNENMDIIHDGETMTLSPKSLIEKVITVSKLQKSKTGGQDYCLHSFVWNPNKEEDD